jgi:hypothetical protein
VGFLVVGGLVVEGEDSSSSSDYEEEAMMDDDDDDDEGDSDNEEWEEEDDADADDGDSDDDDGDDEGAAAAAAVAPASSSDDEEAEEAAARARAEHTAKHGPPRRRAASGYYGVNARGKRWKVQINYGGKTHYLGSYATKQEAALAYDREARRRGEKKALNFNSMEEAEEAAAGARAEHTALHGPAKPRTLPGNHGVRAHGKRWEARIWNGGKTHFLGCHATKQEAALAYDRAARALGREKALNFVSMEEAKEAAARARATHTAKHGRSLCARGGGHWSSLNHPTGVRSITKAKHDDGWRIVVRHGGRCRKVHCPCGKLAGNCSTHGGQYLCAHGHQKNQCPHCKREGAEKATYGFI